MELCKTQNKNKNKKKSIYRWFQHDATKSDSVPLHRLSGWIGSTKQFNRPIIDWLTKLDPPIKPNETIFEMGCGVGATLKVINDNVNNLTISGSDFSPNAINKIQTIFPKSNFFCQDMTTQHPVPSDSQDHVISAGALGMYLYKDEMLLAIKEAVRMTKPGGSLCFTHFIGTRGFFVASIIQRVDKSFWLTHQKELGIEKLEFFTLKNQLDRYGFVCNKIKN